MSTMNFSDTINDFLSMNRIAWNQQRNLFIDRVMHEVENMKQGRVTDADLVKHLRIKKIERDARYVESYYYEGRRIGSFIATHTKRGIEYDSKFYKWAR